MKSRFFLILSIIPFSISALAQSDSILSKTSYFISIHAGGLLAEKGNGSSLSVALLQGVRHQRLAFGIGIGYDAYTEWRTLPLFGSLSYDFAQCGGHAFFVQVNGGYSKAWNPVVGETQFKYKQENGNFFHPLMGFRIRSESLRVYFTAGYKFQRLAYQQTPTSWIWGYPASSVTTQRDMERISVQIGVGFH